MKKTTQKNVLAAFTMALMGLTASGQAFYTNGGLSTGTTTSNGTTTSPAGYTWSELQSVGGSTNTNLGFGAIFNTAATTNLRIADNFTVTSTMNLTTVDLVQEVAVGSCDHDERLVLESMDTPADEGYQMHDW